MMNTFLKSLLLALLATLPLAAQAGFNFSTNDDGTITITGFTGTATAVVVPSSVGGRPVTALGGSSFDYNDNLIKVTIPSTVTNIVRSAFYGCDKLTNITVDALNPTYSSLDGVLFNKTADTLIACPRGRRGGYLVPGSVTNVGVYAFYSCTRLTEVIIGNSVISIGDSAFVSCIALANVIIGDNVATIGGTAFASCFGLTNLAIGESVASIGEYAFSRCTGLTSVTIPNSVTSIDGWAFSDCTKLRGVMLGDSVTVIGGWAFSGCTSLTNITVDMFNPSLTSLDGVLLILLW